MKSIYNWQKASVLDSETDGLLDSLTKIHIIGIQLQGRKDVTLIDGKDHDRIKSMLSYHIDNEIPVVGHNFISFDVPAFEKVLGIDLSKLMVIDTMVLSWYLNVDKEKHSIEELAKDYPEASEKYQIDPDQWETLDWDEAVKRVTSDVEINKIIWEDFKSRLIDMYSLGKEQIDSGNVGGLRVSEDEVLSIDQYVGDSVEEHINRILSFLMFQADVSRLQEETGWEVDVDMVTTESEKLKILLDESKKELESVMPVVAKYAKRTPPKNPFKKNGELSVSGQAWEDRKAKLGKFDEYGNPLAEVREVGSIHELVKYEPPNINSHDQVKAFLFSKGWQPQTFKYERDKEAFDEWVKSKPPQGSKRGAWKAWSESRPEDRAIPQINKEDEDRNKELCDSVLELAEEVPEIKALANYYVIAHRYNFLVGNKGIIKNIDSRGKVAARLGGLASTLRWKHRGLTNLPKADKPFSSSIRGCLVAGKGNVSIGSDLSSLEDRIKHHFMMAHDPEYVKTMLADGYDPHIAMAITAGMITEEEAKYYFSNKGNKEDPVVQKVESQRSKGKTTNYASVYNAGAATIARAAGVDIDEGKLLHEAYWNLNWAVKAIADEQVVVECSRGLKWLVNPINGFLYNLRSEKDRFSALCQGSGSFMFDMWVDRILTKMEERWGRKTMTAQFHDEVVIVCKDHPKAIEAITDIITSSIKEVSEEWKLRRELGCDVQVGYRYSDIH